ncbi:SKP1-like protein 11 [Linum grandiflorum]
MNRRGTDASRSEKLLAAMIKRYVDVGYGRYGTESYRSKTITLTSNDGKSFVMDKAVAKQSRLMKHVIDHAFDKIPFGNISGDLLEKVVGYCEQYSRSPDFSVEEVVNNKSFYKLLMAVRYLRIPWLQDRLCQLLGDFVMEYGLCKTREVLSIRSDFFQQEDEAINRLFLAKFDESIARRDSMLNKETTSSSPGSSSSDCGGCE